MLLLALDLSRVLTLVQGALLVQGHGRSLWSPALETPLGVCTPSRQKPKLYLQSSVEDRP